MLTMGRRALVALLLAGMLTVAGLVAAGLAPVFPRCCSPQQLHTSALYLFSTVAQVLSAVLGIHLATFFILTQLGSKQQYGRVISEIYRVKTPTLTFLVYLSAIIYAIFMIPLAEQVIAQGSFAYFDIGILLAVFSLLLLIPTIVAQVENLNYLYLARKVSSYIVPPAIRKYGLASVECDPHSNEVTGYRLESWGHRHGLYDPLGALHELMMESVHARDRVRLHSLVRVIVERLGDICGVVVPRGYGSSPARSANAPAPPLFHRTLRNLIPAYRPADRVLVTLHIMHYLVRRAYNLNKEWPNHDVLRQLLLINLGDLVLGLLHRKGNEIPIRLSLMAILYICLSFKELTTYGKYEPLNDIPLLASRLEGAGQTENARVAVGILCYLIHRTQFVPRAQVTECLRGLDAPLRRDFRNYLRRLRRGNALPWNPSWDPWRELDPMKQLVSQSLPSDGR